MNTFKIVDLNRSLIQQVKKAGFNAVWADYFDEAEHTPNAVLMTASNPKWTFGGGIDAIFAQKFPEQIVEKQEKGGGMERVGNIVFAITIDENYRATPEIITKAIEFALSTLKESETLVLSGVGTGIGGLSIPSFVEILSKLAPHN